MPLRSSSYIVSPETLPLLKLKRLLLGQVISCPPQGRTGLVQFWTIRNRQQWYVCAGAGEVKSESGEEKQFSPTWNTCATRTVLQFSVWRLPLKYHSTLWAIFLTLKGPSVRVIRTFFISISVSQGQMDGRIDFLRIYNVHYIKPGIV